MLFLLLADVEFFELIRPNAGILGNDFLLGFGELPDIIYFYINLYIFFLNGIKSPKPTTRFIKLQTHVIKIFATWNKKL